MLAAKLQYNNNIRLVNFCISKRKLIIREDPKILCNNYNIVQVII